MAQIDAHCRHQQQMSTRRHNYYKLLSLILLTIQQASMPLMVRYTRIRTDQRVFISTVNVFTMELIKIITCSMILILVIERSFSRYIYMHGASSMYIFQFYKNAQIGDMR